MAHEEVVHPSEQAVATLAWEQRDRELEEEYGEEARRLVWENVTGPGGRTVEIIEGTPLGKDEREDERGIKLTGVITPVILTGRKGRETPCIRLEVITREGVRKEWLLHSMVHGVGQTHDNTPYHYNQLELLVGELSVEPEKLEVTRDGAAIRGLFAKDDLIAKGLRPGDLDNTAPEDLAVHPLDDVKDLGRVASLTHQETEPGSDNKLTVVGSLRVVTEKPGEEPKATRIKAVVGTNGQAKIQKMVHDPDTGGPLVGHPTSWEPIGDGSLKARLPDVGAVNVTKIVPVKIDHKTVGLEVHYKPEEPAN